jgi:hypothetical protein
LQSIFRYEDHPRQVTRPAPAQADKIAGGEPGHHLRLDVAGWVRDREMAARRDGGGERGGDRGYLLVVAQEMRYAEVPPGGAG